LWNGIVKSIIFRGKGLPLLRQNAYRWHLAWLLGDLPFNKITTCNMYLTLIIFSTKINHHTNNYIFLHSVKRILLPVKMTSLLVKLAKAPTLINVLLNSKSILHVGHFCSGNVYTYTWTILSYGQNKHDFYFSKNVALGGHVWISTIRKCSLRNLLCFCTLYGKLYVEF
jgi:hypothetical protein